MFPDQKYGFPLLATHPLHQRMRKWVKGEKINDWIKNTQKDVKVGSTNKTEGKKERKKEKERKKKFQRKGHWPMYSQNFKVWVPSNSKWVVFCDISVIQQATQYLILCSLLDYRYIAKGYTVHTISNGLYSFNNINANFRGLLTSAYVHLFWHFSYSSSNKSFGLCQHHSLVCIFHFFT